MPARSATRALQHPDTECDFLARVEVADLCGGVHAVDRRLVVADAVHSVGLDGLPVDLQRIGTGLELVLNGPVEPADRTNCWVLLIWPFHSPAIATYLSNGNRDNMIDALEETLSQMKAQRNEANQEERRTAVMSEQDDPLQAMHENVLEVKGQVEVLERLVLALIAAQNNPDLIRHLLAQFPTEPTLTDLEPFGKVADVLFEAPENIRRKLRELLGDL